VQFVGNRIDFSDVPSRLSRSTSTVLSICQPLFYSPSTLFLRSRTRERCWVVSFLPTNMSLSSLLGGVDTTDTNCASNSSPLPSPRPRSPPHDTLSGRSGLFPEVQSHELLSPDVQHPSGRTSANSSAMNTPNISRSTSPLPQFYSTQSSASDTDSDEPGSPLLLDTYAPPYLRDRPPRWWHLRQRPRRGARRPNGWGRPIVRMLRRVFRHPFFPKHPTTIVRLILPVCMRVRLTVSSPASFSSLLHPFGGIHNIPSDPSIES
jgi:hypothetical protein